MPRPADRTRRRILDAAYDLFYRKGFGRVGVDEIAAVAGVTKRTLYYHFESKDELLASVLALHSELALARIRKYEEPLLRQVRTKSVKSCSRNSANGQRNPVGRDTALPAWSWSSPT